LEKGELANYQFTLLTQKKLASSAGKTQVALQLSLFVQNPPELGGISGSTCYLTTSAKLPTGRLKQIADSNSQLSPTDCGLDNVHTISISTVPILQNILSNILPSFIQQKTSSPKPVKLVIIDALTELFHSSEKTSKTTLFDRSKDLNRIASALHTIAGTHNVAVVVINEVIDRFERGPAPSSSKDLIYSDKSRWFSTCNSVPGENIKEASLGLVWANQLNARIMLSKTGRRRYIDESELLQAQQQQKKARVDSGSSVQQQTQMLASEDDAHQATLVRRLSVIFSSVAPPVSMDYIITHEGFRVLPDESVLEELKAQSYGFASDESEEVAQSQNQDQNQSSTLPEPAVPAQPSQTQESKDEDEWDRYWEEEDEESKNVDWDALELSLTQAS
jgi:DNA repair protein RAD57